MSRRRDPQLQVSANYSDLTKWMWTISNLADQCHILSSICLKADRERANKNVENESSPAVKGLTSVMASESIQNTSK